MPTTLLNFTTNRNKMKILNLSLMANDDVSNGFVKAMRKVATSGYMQVNPSIPTFNEDAIAIAKTFKPDLIFIQIQQGGILSLETCEELRKTGAFLMNWTGDVRENIPQWMIELSPKMDLTAFSSETDVARARMLGMSSEYLEIGVDIEKYTNHGYEHKCEPIVAFFNHYGANHFPLSNFRVEIVNLLRTIFADKFGVYGNYPNAKENFNDNQIRESQQYNNCKIAINVSHFNYERYSSDRILRAMASGAFVLSHHYSGIEKDFTIGAHLDTFRDTTELVNKCNFYLDNEELRRRIAKQGQEHVRNNFTFDNMAKNIVGFYKQWKENKNVFIKPTPSVETAYYEKHLIERNPEYVEEKSALELIAEKLRNMPQCEILTYSKLAEIIEEIVKHD